MLASLYAFFHNPLVMRAVTGLLGAAGADIHVFKSYRTWAEWRAFSWSTASVRWFWGVIGALTAGTAYAALFS